MSDQNQTQRVHMIAMRIDPHVSDAVVARIKHAVDGLETPSYPKVIAVFAEQMQLSDDQVRTALGRHNGSDLVLNQIVQAAVGIVKPRKWDE